MYSPRYCTRRYTESLLSASPVVSGWVGMADVKSTSQGDTCCPSHLRGRRGCRINKSSEHMHQPCRHSRTLLSPSRIKQCRWTCLRTNLQKCIIYQSTCHLACMRSTHHPLRPLNQVPCSLGMLPCKEHSKMREASVTQAASLGRVSVCRHLRG